MADATSADKAGVLGLLRHRLFTARLQVRCQTGAATKAEGLVTDHGKQWVAIDAVLRPPKDQQLIRDRPGGPGTTEIGLGGSDGKSDLLGEPINKDLIPTATTQRHSNAFLLRWPRKSCRHVSAEGPRHLIHTGRNARRRTSTTHALPRCLIVSVERKIWVEKL